MLEVLLSAQERDLRDLQETSPLSLFFMNLNSYHIDRWDTVLHCETLCDGSLAGDPDIHVKEGSPVRLKCVISNMVEKPPYVTWFLNEKVKKSYYECLLICCI